MHKYPRTQHLRGSRLQPGDEDLDAVPWTELAGQFVVAEEKCDGANAGISFDDGGKLLLQSRGHYLIGGAREKHWDLFKQWASAHADRFLSVLEDRFILYGEWLLAKHTIFYDQLPHYFLEFDVLDTHTGQFLSTQRRRELLVGLPIVSVPVLWQGEAEARADALRERLVALIGHSLYKSPQWRDRLREVAVERRLDPDRVEAETDRSNLMEGLYVKQEADGAVVGRYKYIRPDFLTTILDSGTHWLSRPIVPNQLAAGVELFE